MWWRFWNLFVGRGRLFLCLWEIWGILQITQATPIPAVVLASNVKEIPTTGVVEVTHGPAVESSKISQIVPIPAVALASNVKEIPKEPLRKEIKMETTLIILKPDCMEKGLSGEVISRFSRANFEVVGCKMISLSESLLREHYAHLTHLPFFPEILAFMQLRPVLVLALRKEKAIAEMRDLLGPTDSAIAPKGTIRGDFGTDKMRNIAHASDGEDSAQRELKCFFKSEELFL
jgi:nucleoside-diphosphate kinase